MDWKSLVPKPIAGLARRVRGWASSLKYQKPEGRRGIRKLGHREYVGGLWDEMGQLQFDFLLARGLTPADVLLDIGCGSLRGGIHFIRYLEPGNYLGVEKEAELLRRGVEVELGTETFRIRRPELVSSDSFEFERLSKVPTLVLAQSLFTHLTSEPIEVCMSRLRDFVSPGCRFFATFVEAAQPVRSPRRSHDHNLFRYTREQMFGFGVRFGWDARYIGDWGHPRGQIMVEYVAR